MGVPTSGEKFSELINHLREAQSVAATLGHLEKMNNQDLLAKGWFGVSEMMDVLVKKVTDLAMRKMN